MPSSDYQHRSPTTRLVALSSLEGVNGEMDGRASHRQDPHAIIAACRNTRGKKILPTAALLIRSGHVDRREMGEQWCLGSIHRGNLGEHIVAFLGVLST